jgi:hypothetical protein
MTHNIISFIYSDMYIQFSPKHLNEPLNDYGILQFGRFDRLIVIGKLLTREGGLEYERAVIGPCTEVSGVRCITHAETKDLRSAMV